MNPVAFRIFNIIGSVCLVAAAFFAGTSHTTDAWRPLLIGTAVAGVFFAGFLILWKFRMAFRSCFLEWSNLRRLLTMFVLAALIAAANQSVIMHIRQSTADGHQMEASIRYCSALFGGFWALYSMAHWYLSRRSGTK